MNKVKLAIGLLLLGFAGVSLAVLGLRRGDRGTALPDADVVVCFFRGAQRCTECETIESYAKQAVEAGFSVEIGRGRVAFVSIDWEARGNAKYQDRFKLGMATVVLVWKDGRFRKLDELRYLISDKDAFMRHVQREVGNALKESR